MNTDTKTTKKPKCKLSGEDGNVFNLIGKARKALARAGMDAEAKRLSTEAMAAHSYDEAIQVIMRYCDVT